MVQAVNGMNSCVIAQQKKRLPEVAAKENPGKTKTWLNPFILLESLLCR